MGRRVVSITAFRVPVDESDRFLDRWSEIARIMARQPGMVRARMHRALADDDQPPFVAEDGQPRFVTVVEWESRQALDRAVATLELRASAQRMWEDPSLHFTAHHLVYGVAVELRPEANR